ncbi:hypothetical protein RN001_005438 [Aquatica leii]|uniref:Nuclear receptor domain-containing protein n=1 Tax=Aquatica leii TaxID=1421715 RepID=A0AAN7SIW0_9COLE|nr:hypothetical protein RN001_005438 [Aquatica leii]
MGTHWTVVPDAEVAQIDFHSTSVNLRQKKKLDENDIPRPMSWEGELSEGERDMCIDEDGGTSQFPENLSVTQSKQNFSLSEQKGSPILRLKQSSVNNYSLHSTPSNSPLLSQRHLAPDSAIHSAYSVFSSPSQSPLTQRHLTPNLSRNNSDASHSSCCSYSSVSVSVSPTQQFSPTHSPIQGRHMASGIHGSPLHHNVLYRSLQDDCTLQYPPEHESLEETEDKTGLVHIITCTTWFLSALYKNRKNYVCLRGAACPVTVATRKKCPACRFDKCLQCGMKLEAIREDRTRGGRSTYQCSYSLPPSLSNHPELRASATDLRQGYDPSQQQVLRVKLEPSDCGMYMKRSTNANSRLSVPPLLQDTSELREAEKVRASQEKPLQAFNNTIL